MDTLSSSRLIALLWPYGAADYSGVAQQHVFWGMNVALNASGYHGVFLDGGRCSGLGMQNAERECELLSYVLNNRFGGVVFCSQAHSSNRNLIQEVAQTIPLVLLDRLIPGVRADFVGFQNRDSIMEATSHLINRGHRRIALVTSGECTNIEQERLDGYRLALNEAFPEDAYEMILSTPLTHARAWPMLDAIARLPAEERPTAIICVNKADAVRVADYLCAKNIRVPEEVSLAGFDNAGRILVDGFSLTTGGRPFEEIGSAAAKLILRRSQDPSAKHEHIKLPVN